MAIREKREKESGSIMEENKENSQRSVVASVNAFARDFYKHVASKTKENVVSSALSAHLVLAAAARGADGATGDQLRKALYLADHGETELEEFEKLVDNIQNATNVSCKLANKMCASKSIKLDDNFRVTVSKHFDVEITSFDPSKSVEFAKELNEWCNEVTDSKSQDLVKAADLSASTNVMLLLNAAHFKGSWKYKFDESETHLKSFYVNKWKKVKVPTMCIKKKLFYKYITELDADCVCLPYEEKLYMRIVVPRKINGLRLIEENLKAIDDDEFEKTLICLLLPKFKIESTLDLKELLTKMGAGEVFGDKANFGNVTDARLRLGKVKQRAAIEVDEEGSKVASATHFSMSLSLYADTPLPLQFDVDHPFLYQIVYKNLVLLGGRVVNPLKN